MSKLRTTRPYKMPWGKYRGKTLDEVPHSYLVWLRDEAEDCPKAVIKYLENYKSPLSEPLSEEEKKVPKHPNYYGLFRKNKPKDPLP
jgi:uncharacterized protein (DUF3820 family)